MWERCQTKTNLLRLVPYTVAVAPAACGQLDPCLNMAGNSSPSIPPPIPFSFFLGSNGTENKQSDINGPPQLKSCFACQKDYQNSRTCSNHAKKSPVPAHANYWLWRARSCAEKPVNVFWVFTFLQHFALLQASKKLHAFLAVSYCIANLCKKMARLSDLNKNLCSSSHLKGSV